MKYTRDKHKMLSTSNRHHLRIGNGQRNIFETADIRALISSQCLGAQELLPYAIQFNIP